MATSTLEFDAPQGLTLTAQLYALGADTALISAACTERTNDKGSYTCSIVDIASGTYRLRIKNAGTATIARGLLQHTNSAVEERPAMVDWGSIAAPTTVVALSQTTIKTATDVETDTQDIQATLAALGTGTGSRTITVTVQTSGAVAIQNALVRMVKGGETFTGYTNISGQKVFNLNDGSWVVSATAAGYTYAGTTLVVDGTETLTITMTANSVSAPAAPNLSTGTLLCVGTDGLPEADVVITFKMTAGAGSAGYANSGAEFTAISDINGEIELDFVQLAQYTGRRGTRGVEVPFTVPAAASFTLPEQLGSP